MMILKTMDGNEYKITNEEYRAINNAGTMIHFRSINCVINKNRIEVIYPEKNTDKIIKRKESTIGVLHTGERVKRYFGQWVSIYDMVFDENTGKPTPVKFDPEYYPEIAVDNVATEEEYEEIKNKGLDYHEYLKISEKHKRIGNNFSHISESINKLID